MIFRDDTVGPLAWWIYGAILLLDLLLVTGALTLFWTMADILEDYLW